MSTTVPDCSLTAIGTTARRSHVFKGAHSTRSQHRLGEILHRLPDAQVRQDLLRAAQDGIELDRAVEHLDDPAHARLRQSATAEDVDRLGCDLVGRAGRVRLEQADGAAEVPGLLRVAHVAHLVGDGLEPGLVGFADGDHSGESGGQRLVFCRSLAYEGYTIDSLLSNGWLLDQPLAKDDALVAPFQALLDDGHRRADDGADHHEPLVVEVAHDDDEALVLLAQQVLDGHLDVLELHKGRRGGGRVGRLDGRRLDAFASRDQEHGEALGCPAAGDEVVGEHAVRDPFPGDGQVAVQRKNRGIDLLRAVHDVVLPVGRLLGCRTKAGDITAGECLRHRQTHLLLARQHLLGHSLLELFVVQPLLHRGQADRQAGHVSVLEP